jgi:hypothetical protein
VFLTTLAEMKVDTLQIGACLPQATNRLDRFVSHHAELSVELRLARIALVRYMTADADPPGAGHRQRRERIDFPQRIEVHAQPLHRVAWQP